VEGSCERDNEPSGSIKFWEISNIYSIKMIDNEYFIRKDMEEFVVAEFGTSRN
jgi:hypothetical protein